MKVVGNFEFVGVQEIQGKKDPTKTFYNVVLMQDNDVVKVFCDEKKKDLFKGINKLDKVQCLLSVNIGSDRSYMGIDDCKKLAS
jgi:hypothetical protein